MGAATLAKPAPLQGLFQSQQPLYKILVGMMNKSLLFHQAFSLLGFFGEDVSFESFLESDLPGAGDFESFFGTRVCFNLGHLVMRFKMIPCWRICTGKSLRGPFGQSGHSASGVNPPLKWSAKL